MIQVSISIVSYNSGSVLEKCINSILTNTHDLSFEIIVVDNASNDNTVQLLKEKFPEIILIENKNNVGFGKAHNQAFRVSNGRYFLILNPDTIIFSDAINKVVQFMDVNMDAGVAGCKIWWDDDKNFMFPDLRLHSLKTAILHFTPLCRYLPNNFIARKYWGSAYKLWQTEHPIAVDGVTGGFMMVRREAFKSINGFDENFFLFFEEHDLQKRIKQLGWKVYYIPEAEIQHYFEESCRNSKIDIGEIYLQSALYYYKKHYGALGQAFIKSLLWISQFYELRFLVKKTHYKNIFPDNEKILIPCNSSKNALKYLIEISYSPNFCDRGGMYAPKGHIILKSGILKKLPNNTGFIKISPLSVNNIVEKTPLIFKITEKQ